MRNIEELYDVIEPFNLLCLLADSEPLNFDEAFKDKRSRQAMEEEIFVGFVFILLLFI